MNIGNRYIALHNQGLDQEQILSRLVIEYGKYEVTTWAAINAAETPEGAIAEVIRDKTKYTAPSLGAYLTKQTVSIDFKQGQEQHNSTWAKFYVRGLEQWEVKEDGEYNSKSSYSEYACLNVPVDSVFTVFEQSGDKHGTTTFNYWICKSSAQVNRIDPAYPSGAYVTGGFEIVCHGEGKTKAPRLMSWWIDFTGELDKAQTEKLAFAKHCANHINKRGLKTLPNMEVL